MHETMAMVQVWRAAVRRELDAAASDETKEWGEKYFLGVIDFIGVTGPKLKAIERALRSTWASAPPDVLLAFGLQMQTSRFMEERQVGQLVLDRVVKKIAPLVLVEKLEPIFDTHVRDWATCDALAGRVLRHCLVDARARKRIITWSRAKNTWMQRASAVAFVNEARHGKYDDDVIDVCTRIVKTDERFVQLGCGWVLRELSLVDRPRVLAFLEDNARFVSSEGWRYATEKLPAPVKAAAKARRATLIATGRAASPSPARSPRTARSSPSPRPRRTRDRSRRARPR
jgi:3-methyladenine DNA glycosylase AlkD